VGLGNSPNQVRHYVGGLRAVFAGAEVGSLIMTAREQHGTPSNRADLRLNEISKQHALALSDMKARPTVQSITRPATSIALMSTA
jgi:hypothetical protein